MALLLPRSTNQLNLFHYQAAKTLVLSFIFIFAFSRYLCRNEYFMEITDSLHCNNFSCSDLERVIKCIFSMPAILCKRFRGEGCNINLRAGYFLLYYPLKTTNYRSGTVNSKSFVSKVLLRIKQKFELN